MIYSDIVKVNFSLVSQLSVFNPLSDVKTLTAARSSLLTLVLLWIWFRVAYSQEEIKQDAASGVKRSHGQITFRVVICDHVMPTEPT